MLSLAHTNRTVYVTFCCAAWFLFYSSSFHYLVACQRILEELGRGSLSARIGAEHEILWRICPECCVSQRKVWMGLVTKLWLSWTTCMSAALVLEADCNLYVGWSSHDVTECWISKGELLNVILLSHRCHHNEGQRIRSVWMFQFATICGRQIFGILSAVSV